jgi:hypothetical protein
MSPTGTALTASSRSPDAERGEPVEDALERQLLDAAPEAVGERAGHGERSDDEHQRRVDEALDETGSRRSAALGDQPALQPAARVLESLLEAQQRPDDPADEQRAEDDQQRPAVGDGTAEGGVGQGGQVQPADDEGDQAECVGDRRARALRQSAAQRHAQPGSDEDGRHVQHGPRPAQHLGPLPSITLPGGGARCRCR